MGHRRYEVKDIQARHREMVRMSLLGMKQTSIAAELGVTPQSVSNALNSQPVIQVMATLQEKADEKALSTKERLDELCPAAIRTFEEIMTEKVDIEGTLVYKYDGPLRKSTASDVLDRAGYGRIQRIQGQVVHGFLSPDDIEDIKRRARESIIDVTPAQES